MCDFGYLKILLSRAALFPPLACDEIDTVHVSSSLLHLPSLLAGRLIALKLFLGTKMRLEGLKSEKEDRRGL
jgi:hypothetical protein